MPKETILILDKDLHTQWALKTLLESEKYIVLAVNSIERSLQNFQEFEVCGLITEYQIGHAHTPEMVRDLKRSFPELYVMMLTDEDLDEKEYRRIMSSGTDDLFLKPVSSEKILIHLKKGLRQRQMLVQKNRLEQRLKELEINGNVQKAGLGKDRLFHNKSFTER